MKFLLYLTFVILIHVSNGVVNAQQGSHSRYSSVVVFFKNHPDIDSYFYFTKRFWVKSEKPISFIQDRTMTDIEIKPTALLEPIIVNVTNKHIVLRCKIDFLQYNDFILTGGDSVSIEYNNGKPNVQILNRTLLPFDGSFEDLTRSILNQGKYSPIASYLGAYEMKAKIILSSEKLMLQGKTNTYRKNVERNDRFMQEIKDSLFLAVQTYLQREREILDSVKIINRISDVPYQYHKSRLQHLVYLTALETNRLSKSELSVILKTHELNRVDYPEPYFDRFVEASEDKFILHNLDFLELKDEVNRDYRKAFMLLDTSMLFPDRERNFLLTKELGRIYQAFSHDDFLEFFGRYEKIVNDVSQVADIKKMYALEFDINRSETKSIALSGLVSGEKITFEDLKRRHKGKVIYVDFWASWCRPCREAMPASEKLREALGDRNIVFIYLSIDNNLDAWKTASVKEGLNDYRDNFLVVNHKTSQFFKDNRLNSIPRYMIFDKTGRLIYANAPRVESSDIGLLLSRLADKP